MGNNIYNNMDYAPTLIFYYQLNYYYLLLLQYYFHEMFIIFEKINVKIFKFYTQIINNYLDFN